MKKNIILVIMLSGAMFVSCSSNTKENQRFRFFTSPYFHR